MDNSLVSANFNQASEISSLSAKRVGGFGRFDATTAICVGYLQTNILMVAKMYDNGGWLVSTLSIIVASMIMLYGSQKLVQCALRLGVYNYGEIVAKTFGQPAKILVSFAVVTCQILFCVVQVDYSIESLVTVFGLTRAVYVPILFVLYSVVSWNRNTKKYMTAYILSFCLIMYTAFLIMAYCLEGFDSLGKSSNIIAVNKER
jgi:amino acid permease